MSASDYIAHTLNSTLGTERAASATMYLLDLCASRAWKDTDPFVRIGRMCAEVAQCENKERGVRQGSERAVAGSTRVTIVRDFCAVLVDDESADYAQAWSAVCAKANVPSGVGAGDRVRGTRSDAADAIRAAMRK